MRQQDFTKEIRVFKGDGIIFLYKTDVLAGNGVVGLMGWKVGLLEGG